MQKSANNKTPKLGITMLITTVMLALLLATSASVFVIPAQAQEIPQPEFPVIRIPVPEGTLGSVEDVEEVCNFIQSCIDTLCGLGACEPEFPPGLGPCRIEPEFPC
jgi:hypothetical protein